MMRSLFSHYYVVARYRHPLVPIILLFSAAGLGGLLDIRRRVFAPAVGGKRDDGNSAAIRETQSPQPEPDLHGRDERPPGRVVLEILIGGSREIDFPTGGFVPRI